MLARITLLVLMMTMTGGCKHGENGGTKKTAAIKHATVVLQAAGKTLRVKAEVARTEEQRAKGLMYREELAEYSGMLFLFDVQQIQTFWMKNTYIWLDMIFIDKEMKVVGVVQNAEPRTESPRRVEVPSFYVLEVKGGWAARHGLGIGATVKFEGL